MKIAKSQLQRIIKEELSKALDEENILSEQETPDIGIIQVVRGVTRKEGKRSAAIKSTLGWLSKMSAATQIKDAEANMIKVGNFLANPAGEAPSLGIIQATRTITRKDGKRLAAVKSTLKWLDSVGVEVQDPETRKWISNVYNFLKAQDKKAGAPQGPSALIQRLRQKQG